MFEHSGLIQRLISRVNHALNYDFCPDYNKYVYWMKHPLVGISVAAFSASLCAYFVAPQAWLLFLGLLLVGVFGLVWPAISICATQATIHYEQAWCEEGLPTRIHVHVRNYLPWPAWGISLVSQGEKSEILVSFAKAHGWRKTGFHWEWVPEMRGVYPDAPIYLQSAFPFGVWTVKRPVKVEGELVVLPRPFEFDAVPDVGEGHCIDEVYSDRKVGDLGDVTGTRPFRHGDSLRRVHWSLTARLNRLICCERQAALQSTAHIHLDVCHEHHTVGAPDSTLEWSIRIFAGLCQELANHGIAVVAFIGNESIPVGSGKIGLQRLLMRLARLPRAGLRQQNAQMMPLSQAGLLVHVMTDKSITIQSGLAVVLDSTRFSCPTERSATNPIPQDAAERVTNSHQVFISNHDEIHSSLRSQWRRLCSAVS